MELALPANFSAANADQVLARARGQLNLPADAQLHVDNVTQTARETRIDFSYTTWVALEDEELMDASGVRVTVDSHGTLHFNAKGEFTKYDAQPADPSQLRAISDHVSKLVANGEVYVAKPGEKINPDELRAQGKTWYVEQDAAGQKRLKRAWIS